METIEQLIKLCPEEVYGDAEASDAGIEYQRELAFAAWQLRARALMDEAWALYRHASSIENALRQMYDRHQALFTSEGRAAVFADVRQAGAHSFSRFQVWSALSKLARAEGREDITPQQEADALAVIAQMEEVKIEKLLAEQATQRKDKFQREAVGEEKAQEVKA